MVFQIIVLHLRISRFFPIKYTGEVSLTLLYPLQFRCEGETDGTRSPLRCPSSSGHQSSVKWFCSIKVVPACQTSVAWPVWPTQTITTSPGLWESHWRAPRAQSNDQSGSDLSCHCSIKFALIRYGDNLYAAAFFWGFFCCLVWVCFLFFSSSVDTGKNPMVTGHYY